VASILVAVLPFAGHTGPLRAVARVLAGRGHDVRVLTGSRYAAQVDADGARALVWSGATDFAEDDLEATFPGLRRFPAVLRGAAFIDQVVVGTGASQVADLCAAWAEQPWDVLLADSTAVGAAIAAELTGAPWAALVPTPLLLPDPRLPPPGLGVAPRAGLAGRARDVVLGVAAGALTAPLQRTWRAQRRLVGLSGPSPAVAACWLSPSLVLASGSPAIEHRRRALPPQVHFIGAPDAPPPRPVGLPPWWSDVLAAHRPLVHVTQGTLDTDPAQLLAPALTGLAGEDVLVAGITGGTRTPTGPGAPDDGAAAALRRGLPGGRLPANARTAELLPYADLLPRTAVVVTNGGYGTVLAALRHGVPLVVAGEDVDKPEVARRVAASGAGIDLRTARPRPRAVRDAVRTVLADPSSRAAAARVGADLASCGGAPRAADLVEQLLATGGPVLRPAGDPWARAGAGAVRG
jgi:UDP:flavonoid glycosyltransferase YjiC (YdhE family)